MNYMPREITTTIFVVIGRINFTDEAMFQVFIENVLEFQEERWICRHFGNPTFRAMVRYSSVAWEFLFRPYFQAMEEGRYTALYQDAV